MNRNGLFKLLVILNIAAVFTGTYYYLGQLAATPLPLWPFVPDCPLYVLLAIPILLGIIKNGLYRFIVSIGMAKYGLWTVFVLLFHADFYFLPEFLAVTIVFIIGHIGMALEGAALIPQKKLAPLALILALGWFLLNDYADYFAGTRPLIPSEGIEFVRNLTIAASVILSPAFYFWGERIHAFPPVKAFRRITGF